MSRQKQFLRSILLFVLISSCNSIEETSLSRVRTRKTILPDLGIEEITSAALPQTGGIVTAGKGLNFKLKIKNVQDEVYNVWIRFLIDTEGKKRKSIAFQRIEELDYDNNTYLLKLTD